MVPAGTLKSILADMGMPVAFSKVADFSGIADTTANRDLGLYIKDVIHKAFVLVNETGTEAAAATAGVMAQTTSIPEQPVRVTVDRPFVFLIRDIKTGTVLFVGRVLDPSP